MKTILLLVMAVTLTTATKVYADGDPDPSGGWPHVRNSVTSEDGAPFPECYRCGCCPVN